jgi:beta-N-acetylhexosaminidase
LDPERSLLIDLPGPELDAAWRAHLRRYRFGGVCLFRRNVSSRAQLAALTGEVRSLLGQGAWIAIDHEGGAVWRVADLPHPPAAMALAAAGSAEWAREVGGAVARGLRSLGVNWNFAPVLDVNRNPDNPVIAERSFGADPAEVIRLGLAFAEGSEREGVMATAKHFPGHGNTHTDSHLELPALEDGLEQLALDLLPFRAAARAGIGAVMTAHILTRQLDPELPATLSHRVLTELLRGQIGYLGLVVSDSLQMRAISDRFSPGEAVRRTLLAGADLALALGPMEAQAEAAEAARSLGEALLAPKAERAAAAARRFPARPGGYPAAQEQADRALFLEVARAAVTAWGSLPPLPSPGQRLALLVPEISGETAEIFEPSPAGLRLHALLRAYFPGLQLVGYQAGRLRSEPLADYLLFATTGHAALPAADLALAHRLAEQRPLLHLAVWNPYHAPRLGLPALISYGADPYSLQALAEVVSAGRRPEGRLPSGLRPADAGEA